MRHSARAVIWSQRALKFDSGVTTQSVNGRGWDEKVAARVAVVFGLPNGRAACFSDLIGECGIGGCGHRSGDLRADGRHCCVPYQDRLHHPAGA